jgi:OmpA-OmpF porin, OOP family
MALGRKTIMAGILILSLCMAGTVMGEIRPGAVTISPMVGGLYFDHDDGLNEDNHPNLFSYGLGYNINKNWAIELLLGYAKPTFEAPGFSTTVQTYQYQVDGVFHLLPESMITPYLAGGIGAITYDPDAGGSQTKAQFNVGGGLKMELNEMFALRADVRKMLALDNSDIRDLSKHDNWSYLLGVTMSFGGEKEVMAAPEPPPAPAPEPVVVAPAPEPPCTDTDGDGVCDDVDKCPNTPKGATVDERGCWVISCVVLFDLNKADLKPMAKEELDKIYNILKEDGLTIEIQGYTCNLGTEEYNRKLSERRANSVKSYLMKKGISKDRLTTVGYGESNPAASNDTEEGRAKNRRVEFKTVD